MGRRLESLTDNGNRRDHAVDTRIPSVVAAETVGGARNACYSQRPTKRPTVEGSGLSSYSDVLLGDPTNDRQAVAVSLVGFDDEEEPEDEDDWREEQ